MCRFVTNIICNKTIHAKRRIENNELWGNFLCAAEKRGLNQSDVADYLGITRGAYGMYEIGRRKIDVDTLVKLCRFFEVTPNEVLGFEE